MRTPANELSWRGPVYLQLTSSPIRPVSSLSLRLRAVACGPLAAALALLAGPTHVAMADSDSTRWSRQRSAIASPATFLADGRGHIYLYEPSGHDTLLQIHTGTTRFEIRSMPVAAAGRIHDVTSVPDLDDDGIAEIALLKTGHKDSGSSVVVLDGASGSERSVRALHGDEPLGLISLGRSNAGAVLSLITANERSSVNLNAVYATVDGLSATAAAIDYPTITNSWAALSLPTGDGPDSTDIAIVGVSEDGTTTAAVKDAKTGEPSGSLSFGARLVPADIIALPDVFPDGSPELALLGDADDGRLVGVVIKELGSGKTVARYRFSPNHVPMRLLHIPAPGGAGMLGVIGQRGNGSIALQRRNLDTGKALENVRFRAHYAPDDAALLKLPGTDRGEEVAITGFDAFGHGRLEVRDATTGELMLDHDLRRADE